jgi:transposase
MRPYSNDLRSRVVAAMEAGGSCRAVAVTFGLAPSTVGNWHRQYRRTQSYAPLVMGGDRRWKLSGELGWIAERLATVRDLTLAEVRNDLAARGVVVSYAGVQRTVKRLGLRFKKNDLCDGAGPA